MKSKYQSYPSYTDSGVEWLGEIPNEWKRTNLKYIADINMGQSPSSSTYNNENIGTEFLQGNADFGDRYPTARTYTTDPKKLSKPDDILFTVRAPVGAMNIGKTKYAIGRGLCAINSTKHSHKAFLWWLMPIVKSELDTVATGSTYEAVSVEQVNNAIVLLPPLQEQQTIANYLDKATAKIDTLIEKQTKLIEILKEKRQAVISTAVTRGLNSSVPMKDSGVEWLGEIPEHWEVKKFKYLFEIRKRISGKLGYDILSITQKGIKVKDIESGKGQLSSDYTKYQHVYKGDYAMNHMDLLTGFVDLSKYDGVTSPDYRVFSVIEKHADANYYLFLLQMGYINKIFYPLGQGSSQFGRWRLPSDAFKEFQAPFPPQEEQEEIAKFVDSSLEKFAQLTTKATKAIELLKERRAALISAVVTGKIDVRGNV